MGRTRSAMKPHGISNGMRPLDMSAMTGKITVKRRENTNQMHSKYARNRGQSVDRMLSSVSNTTSLMVRGRTESEHIATSGSSGSNQSSQLARRYGVHGQNGSVHVRGHNTTQNNVRAHLGRYAQPHTQPTMDTVVLHENVSSINSVDYLKLRKFLDGLDEEVRPMKHHENSDAQSSRSRQDMSTSSDEQILERSAPSERTPFRMDV